ncbi:MAG: DNA polymerase domain-containing protein [Victivallaceae bacterium]|nr:DNA polymerase domain-containing protein [Victivallaceae bacterium]
MEQLIPSCLDNVTAVECDGREAVFFCHDGSSFRMVRHPFRPFMVLPGRQLPDNIDCECTALDGDGELNTLVRFDSPEAFDDARKKISRVAYVFNDSASQAMIACGVRQFTAMEFNGLRRMQFAVETAHNGRITAVAVNGSGQKAERFTGQEDEIISQFVQAVTAGDPDVLEGYNPSRFDLPALEKRAAKCNVPLAIGRDGSTPTRRPSRFNVAERTVSCTRYAVWGRHVVDLLYPAMMHDASHRDMDSLELAGICEYFNIKCDNQPQAIEQLGYILLPSYFYQARLLPFRYQDAITRGNGICLDAMLVAEYLTRGTAIPLPELPRRFAGALTGAEAAGVFHNVWHCDARSLYPSIILTEKWTPQRDRLGVFPELLGKLRHFRLEAKDAARHAATQEERRELDALQSSFKILINSFYGYLGFAQGSFNDFDMAERVTTRGRQILTLMRDALADAGATIIEMDTDGIYFSPPDGADRATFAQPVQAALPDGIEIELDAFYRTMFCYKSKNYALADENGVLHISGAALKSRGLEPFLRGFLRTILTALTGLAAPATVAAELERLRDEISGRTIALAELARTENLNDPPAVYRRKMESGKGVRRAACELALKSGRDFRAGDKVTYYITGEKKKLSAVDNSRLLSDADPAVRDENIAWYLNKLDELYANFAPFLEEVK